MRMFIVGVLLIGLSGVGVAIAGTPRTPERGIFSCASWNAPEYRAQQTWWVVGFEFGASAATLTPTPDLWDGITQYCAAHPDQQFLLAARAVLRASR